MSPVITPARSAYGRDLTQYRHPPGAPRPRTELHTILERGRFSKETRKTYRVALDQWLMFAGIDPKRWTRTSMIAWRAELISRGLFSTTIETYLAAVHYCGKWYCSERGLPDFSLIQPIDLPEPAREAKARPPLTFAQAERLLESCSDPDSLFDRRDLTLLIVGLETGMRRKSLAGARFDQIGTSQGGSGAYPSIEVPIKGRYGDQTWKVPLSDLALRAIASWRPKVRGNGPMFPPLTDRADQRSTRHLTEMAIYLIVTGRARATNLAVHPHILRHTFVTWRRLMGIEPHVIASVTGHSSGRLGDGVLHYMSPEAVGEGGRQTTPPQLVEIADPLLRRFES